MHGRGNISVGQENARRWWDFEENDWKLAKYIWHTNRLLLILEPGKCYSTILFWNHETNEFLCYYINFQIPFQRRYDNVDTLDLELDLIINPDGRTKWKDEEDYLLAIDRGLISSKWMNGIEDTKQEIFERIEEQKYPFDGSWLNWRPDPSWEAPKLPENWDKI